MSKWEDGTLLCIELLPSIGHISILTDNYYTPDINVKIAVGSHTCCSVITN